MSINILDKCDVDMLFGLDMLRRYRLAAPKLNPYPWGIASPTFACQAWGNQKTLTFADEQSMSGAFNIAPIAAMDDHDALTYLPVSLFWQQQWRNADCRNWNIAMPLHGGAVSDLAACGI